MTAYEPLSAKHELAHPLPILPLKHGLDEGIGEWVNILRAHGVETFESCQGGMGHAYPEPTIRFHGNQPDGFHALAVARTFALPVSVLRRFWTMQDGEPIGPYWEIVFHHPRLVER